MHIMEQDPENFQKTSSILQKVDLDLVAAVEMLRYASVTFVENLREQFEEFEMMAKQMSVTQEYRTATSRKIKRKTRADESTTPDHILTDSEKFRVDVFLVIIDNLISMLQRRCNAYEETCRYWGFLTRLKGMPTEEMRAACRNLVQKYCEDLQEHLDDELVQLLCFAAP